VTVEEIYKQHVDFVTRTLRRCGVDSSDLSDATQEVFLTVHRTLSDFEGRCSVTTWLFTICRSTARDRRERAYRRHEVRDDAAACSGFDNRADPDAQAQRNQMVRLLETLLAELVQEQREVFMLFEIEGFTGEEVAEAVGAPLGTVYSRLRLARQAFRAGIERYQKQNGLRQQRAGAGA
jgi:RNA polymerase sigma-70 factor, ECF subfamily